MGTIARYLALAALLVNTESVLSLSCYYNDCTSGTCAYEGIGEPVECIELPGATSRTACLEEAGNSESGDLTITNRSCTYVSEEFFEDVGGYGCYNFGDDKVSCYCGEDLCNSRDQADNIPPPTPPTDGPE